MKRLQVDDIRHLAVIAITGGALPTTTQNTLINMFTEFGLKVMDEAEKAEPEIVKHLSKKKLIAAIQDLDDRGFRIGAIKLLRAQRGISLSEALNIIRDRNYNRI